MLHFGISSNRDKSNIALAILKELKICWCLKNHLVSSFIQPIALKGTNMIFFKSILIWTNLLSISSSIYWVQLKRNQRPRSAFKKSIIFPLTAIACIHSVLYCITYIYQNNFAFCLYQYYFLRLYSVHILCNLFTRVCWFH